MLALAPIGVVLILVILGLPVAFALMTIGSSLLAGKGLSLLIAPNAILEGMDSFVLIAIPCFILMSNLLLQCGVGKQLFEAMRAWVGHLPGGLAIATILSCGVFSATSGSSVTTSATVGVVAIPELRQHGYNERFIYGLLAAGGTIGILIPPSIPMIVYAFVMEESVIDMFAAGVFPGLLIIGLFSLYAIVHVARAANYTRAARMPWRARIPATLGAAPCLILVFVIFAGIYGGVFTPTEASGVGVATTFAIVLFWTRNLTFARLRAALRQTMTTSIAIMLIVASAKLFGMTIAFYQVPQELSQFIGANVDSQALFVLLVCAALVVLGLFLEGISMVVLMMPVLAKSVMLLGVDPIWFGVIFVMMVEVALITPPVGLNLFVIQSISGASLKDVFLGVRPFIVLFFIAAICVYAFPVLTTALPALLKA